VVGKPNYKLVIARCPGKCNDDAWVKKVYGVGIHPGESSICKSAIYDKAIPLSGGIIGVGIMPGL
jgi:hypothetical protein